VKFLGLKSHLGNIRTQLKELPAPLGSVCLHIWRKGSSKPEVEIF
jgi:hypothetical protein